MNKPTVLIIVSGGVVQNVYSTEKINLVVIDHDNLQEDDDPKPSRETPHVVTEQGMEWTIEQEMIQYNKEESHGD